ncbi:hypothetical protein CSW32_08270 [Thermus scotoductus]|nr:hypothetical protein CSW32_08270 [Thermus scotoductus]
MAKTSYTCVECGYKTPKPLGRCPACGAWESFQEVAPPPPPPALPPLPTPPPPRQAPCPCRLPWLEQDFKANPFLPSSSACPPVGSR